MLLAREVLQGIFSGVANAEDDYLADKIVPATPGPQYGVIGIEDFLSKLDDIRDADVTACAPAKQIPSADQTQVNYATQGYSLKDFLCYDVEALNQVAVTEAERIMARLRGGLKYLREKRLEALIRTGTWNAASTAVGAGDQWDTSTGDPMAQLVAAARAIPGGPDTIIMGVNAFASFQTNANVRGYLSNDSFRFLGAEAYNGVLSAALSRPVKLFVPMAHDGAAGTFIWDDDVFVARIAGQGSRGRMGPLLSPTALARIESAEMRVDTKHEVDAGVRGGQLIHVAHEEALVQVTADLGVLYTAVNG